MKSTASELGLIILVTSSFEEHASKLWQEKAEDQVPVHVKTV